MIDQVHVIAQPVQDLRMCAHIRARLVLGLDSAACGGNLANAEEGCDGLFCVAVIEQPVRGNNGRDQGVGADNGHVAARGGG